MKKFVALLLIAMMLFTQVSVMAQPNRDQYGNYRDGTMTSVKILAIGNSFSVDSMQWLYDILSDMGVQDIVLGNLYIGGCTLQTHAKNVEENAEKYTYYKCSKDTNGKWETVEGKKSILYGLQDEEWDYISLQQASGQSGIPSSYEPYLTQLVDYVRRNAIQANVKLMWNMTWAYQADSTHGDFAKYANNQDVMYSAIINAVNTNIVNNDSFDFIIPCGTAVQNMRTSAIGDTLTRDGYHMNKVYGRYLLGVMWAKTITAGSLGYLSTFPESGDGISPVMLDAIKESVENAFEKPFEVTNSINRAAEDRTDYADCIANCFVDVTDQGTYDAESGIFTFNHNGAVARHGKDIAYLGTQAASLNGQPCAYIDGKFYVPQAFIDYKDGSKEYTPIESGTFDVDMVIEKNADKWVGKISLTNYLTGIEAKGGIKFKAPASLKDVELEIKPTEGLTSSVTFDIPEVVTNGNYYDFVFDFENEGKTYSYNVSEEIVFAEKAEGIVVDGVMSADEWDNAYVITCDKESQAANLKDWKGTSDINAKSYVAWDEESIYIAGVAEDNNFTGPAKESLPWEGDSIQFAIFHDKDGNNFVPGSASSDFHEVALSLFEGKASVYKSKAQTGDTKTGLVENAKAAVVNNGTNTVYEFSMTWKDLLGYDYAPKADDVFGFSILYNDNDGNGRRGWIEYGGGIGGTKDANEFAQMYLAGAEEEDSDEIKVYVNGKKLAFDQPPVLLNNRTLVPVRAIFEELGAVVMWNNTTQTALAVKGDLQITIKIGVTVMMANDKEITLDVPAQLINNRTLVPLRAIAEALGNTVEWDGATQTVTITD